MVPVRRDILSGGVPSQKGTPEGTQEEYPVKSSTLPKWLFCPEQNPVRRGPDQESVYPVMRVTL